MRHGYTAGLQKRLERDNPSAHLIVEAVTTVVEYVIDRLAEWNTADSLTGFTLLNRGGVKLTGTPDTYISQTTDDGTDITDLDVESPWEVAMVRWGLVANIEKREISSLTANLVNRDNGGNPGEVTKWRARLYRVAKISIGRDGNDEFELQEIARADAAPGAFSTSHSDITFNFVTGGVVPTVGPGPIIEDEGEIATGKTAQPMTVVRITALKGEGVSAGNVGWAADGSTPETTLGADVVSHEILTTTDDSRVGTSGVMVVSVDATPGNGVPRILLKGGGYSESTIQFTGAGNDIDLGQAPGGSTRLMVEAVGQTPSDSALEFELDDGSGMVTVNDGDIIGEDNTAIGGANLSGMTRQQAYDGQVTLTPSGNLEVTPIVRRFGVRELTWEDLDELVNVGDASWQVDPKVLVGNIPEIELTLLKDGLRDYRDAATELLSDNFIGGMEFRIFVGHPDLARQDWLHIDDFVIHNQRGVDGALVIECISPISLLNRIVPVQSSQTREPLVYTSVSDTVKSVYEDIITGQITSFPSRRIGAVLEDTTPIGKTIRDPVTAKTVLDQIAFIVGHGVIGSQGRLKAVDMSTREAPVESFPSESITVLNISPGYDERMPDVGVQYGWSNNTEGEFDSEGNSQVSNAITNYGRAPLSERESEHIDEETAKWIPDSPTAVIVADRLTEQFATGMILLQFESIYPMPHLEPGDSVSVETDLFVARDPGNSVPIRGNQWVTGKIAAVHDTWGTKFTVWVHTLADIIPQSEDIDRSGFAHEALIVDVSVRYNNDDEPIITVEGNVNTVNIYVTATVDGTPLDPTASVNDGAIVGARGTVTATGKVVTLSNFVEIKAVGENVNGDLGQVVTVKLDRGADISGPIIQIQTSQSGSTGTFQIDLIDKTLVVTDIEYQLKEDGGDYGGSWLTAWTSSTGTAGVDDVLQRTKDIALLGKHSVKIKWQVIYDNGDILTIGDEVTFDEDEQARILNAVLFYDDATGGIKIAITGDEDCVEHHAKVGFDGVEPADPTHAANDGTLVGQSGTLTTVWSALYGREIIVKVVGENPNGDLGPVFRLQGRRGDGSTHRPEVRVQGTRSGEIATARIEVDEIFASGLAVTAIEYKLREDEGTIHTNWQPTGSPFDAWTTSTGTPGSSSVLVRTKSVTVTEGKDSEFLWRVVYNDESGQSREVGGSINLGNLRELDRTDRIAGVDFTPEMDTSAWHYTTAFGAARGTAVTLAALKGIHLSVGIEVTKLRIRGIRQNGADLVEVALWESTDAGGTAQIGSVAALSTTGSVSEVEVTLSKTILVDKHHTLKVRLNSQNVGLDGRVFWVELDLTVPSFAHTYSL